MWCGRSALSGMAQASRTIELRPSAPTSSRARASRRTPSITVKTAPGVRGPTPTLSTIDAAQGDVAPAAPRFVEQGLAVTRVSKAEGTGHIGGEDVERQRRSVRVGGIAGLVIGDVARQKVAAGPEQQIEQPKAAHFGHPPGRDPLAAHVILEHLALFQQQHRAAGARRRDGQRRSADAAADDDQVIDVQSRVSSPRFGGP